MRRGFTLIELSIVLVIIGLLIGGILVAQSMIESAKLQKFVRQIQQYDAMISNFKSKFGCLPGDNSIITSVGDCDSDIYDNDARSGDFEGEIASVWEHLAMTEMTNKNFTSTISAGVVVGDGSDSSHNVPEVEMGTDASIIIASAWSGLPNFPIGTELYAIRKAATTGTSDVNANGANVFTPTEALSIEIKMDDGSAIAGNIRATRADNDIGIGNASTLKSASNVACLIDDANDDTYDVVSTDIDCSLDIKLLSQVGQE